MNNILLNSVADDVFEILEELYNSANAISEERINKCAMSLCDSLGIDAEMISYGLNVKHYRQ